MNQARGLFITTESVSDKHREEFTICLKAALVKLGVGAEKIYIVTATNSTAFGRNITKAVDQSEISAIPSISLYLLDLATQEELLQNVIFPLLNKGYIVICDEFHDGSHTQLVHGFQKRPAINHNGQLFVNQKFPSIQSDLTFVLDIEPLQALDSTTSVESDELPSQSAELEFLVRTRNGFITRAESFPERIKLLDASQPAEQNAEFATSIINDLNLLGRSN